MDGAGRERTRIQVLAPLDSFAAERGRGTHGEERQEFLGQVGVKRRQGILRAAGAPGADVGPADRAILRSSRRMHRQRSDASCKSSFLPRI